MSRVVLAITAAFIAVTAAYNNVAIAQFFQSKNNDSFSKISKSNEFNRDYTNNYFSPIDSKEFLGNYQARTGSNIWFMNALYQERNLQQETEPLYFSSQVKSGNQRNIRERETRTPTTTERQRRQQRRASSSSSRAQETSAINLDSHDLKQPHNLVVTTEKGTQLTGQITLDGKVIQTIRGNRTAINLSSCLSRGRHLVEVFGNYKPTNSSVQVEFSAPGTRVSQATGGNGVVRQTLILDVR